MENLRPAVKYLLVVAGALIELGVALDVLTGISDARFVALGLALALIGLVL